MKILRISLQNLASLEGTHHVDFTAEPLQSAGLFSISGPTGAGKSTLLDALCLALYNDTPRLHKIANARLPNGESQSDPRGLLRRGAGSGWAEVAFVGTDSLTYTAQWQVRRAGNKADGALQHSQMALFKGDVRYGQQGQSAGGGTRTEVLELIRIKVGLSFEQFTRAIMLAQGDFAAFLKAKDTDRADILEALTDTGRFSTIGREVHERHSRAKEERSRLEALLGASRALSVEDRQLLQTQLIEAEQQQQQALQNHQAAKQRMEWFVQLHSLEVQLAAAQQALEAAITAKAAAAEQEAELQLTQHTQQQAATLRATELRAEKEATVAQAAHATAQEQRTQSLQRLAVADQQLSLRQQAVLSAQQQLEAARPQLQQARILDAQLPEKLALRNSTQLALQKLQQELQALTAERRSIEEALALGEKTRAALQAELARDAAWQPFADQLEAWVDRLSACHATQQQLATTKREHDKATLASQRSSEQLRLLQSQLPGAEEQAQKIAQQLTELDEALAPLSLPSLLVSKEAVQQRSTTAELQLQQHEQGQSLLAQQEQIHVELLRLEQQSIPTATQVLATLEDLLSQIQPSTQELRGKLQHGMPCPVCGSAEHPYLEHPPESPETSIVMKQVAKARKDLDQLRSAATTQQALLAERQRQLALLPALELDARVLAAAIAELSSQRQELERSITQHSQLQARRAQAASSHNAAQQALHQTQQRLGQAQAETRSSQDALAFAQRQLAQLQQSLAQQQASLQPLIQLQPSAENQPERMKAELLQRGSSLSATRERFTITQQAQAQAAAELSRVSLQLDHLQQRLALAESDQQAAANALQHLQQARATLLAGQAADAVEHRLHQACHAAAAEQKAADDAQRNAATEVTAREQDACTAESHHTTTTATAQRTAAAMDAWLSAQSMERSWLDSLLARTPQWLADQQRQLASLAQAEHQATGNLQARSEDLANHQQHCPTDLPEETAQAALAECDDALRICSETLEDLRVKVRTDDASRSYQAATQQQLEEHQRKHLPLAQLHDVIGSQDGGKFRDIAQRRTLDILLVYANDQLTRLSPRYQLRRLPDSLGLTVQDSHMGEHQRSVHSLSGGETFLASLALALGLAALTSQRLRIESLFIDEGFGSLDREALNIAMSALMQLESQGRKVGVISHVVEMEDAIPIQIQVKPKGRTGASTLIVPGAELSSSAHDERDQVKALALQLLAHLHNSGKEKVSVRELCTQLACEPAALRQAEAFLGPGRVERVGVSLRLSSSSG
jgi:DNA repair protein SbcC/Rad50